ncbi:acyl-[ACP]--phospholipid O-acyltransferase [Geothermobacter hydrogeniphilus]|uniref:Acyl-[ACP]--phospholipid O-acyltransferase n=1 Tax=Geothermobacter hydrogeniphilus TaxID=1969733 RepID=A0A1X0Y0J4_9BACT|nr:acyl-[ACP]--phospholipid O-acyltransferase [Geothermobacter hydrogeniphilus]ORJ58700.1 acyl-[ACP]--phospholipid O-acyltransferase [Geothermobacter hydrogeniphilus]
MNQCSHGFRWLNITQFLGALNDNLFKLLLVFLIIDLQGVEAAGRVAAIAGLVFVLPFLLFSAAAGRLVDRFSKTRLIRYTKLLELAVMLLGVAAFAAASVPGLYGCLLLMALQSTLFSPAKYGIVPELVDQEQLSSANGSLEALTYLAIIGGTALAPLLPTLTGNRYGLAALVCVLAAVAGLLASYRIPPTPATGTRRQGSLLVIPDLVKALRFAREDGFLLLAVLGSAWFMLLGAFFQLNLIPYGIETLGLNQQQSGALFLVAALGIGLGSLTAGRLSGRNIEFGIVPLGTLGLTIATWLLALTPGRLPLVILIVLLLGVSSGLIIVPLNAFIQQRTPPERRGEILAAAGMLGWFGVLLASLLLLGLGEILGLSSRECFAALGLVSIGLTLWAFRTLPDFFLRFITLLVMRFAYRIRVAGRDHVPASGGALLVANHVSWIDALLLVACEQRRIRFLMERGIYNRPGIRQLFRLMGVIPISSRDRRKDLVASLREARQALDDGYLVCIFAEGQITRNASLGEFKSGFESIVKGSGHPVIPVYLGGLWGSIFSYSRGRLLAGLPRIPYPVDILFGAPLPDSSDAGQVRQAVMEMSSDWHRDRQQQSPSLGRQFALVARRNWRAPAISDTAGKRLRYGQTLTAALALGRQLEQECWGERMVGVLLPPSVGGALVNLALTLVGKIPVNLNYTASAEAFDSACRQCGLRTIISAEAFLERFEQFQDRTDIKRLEELLPAIPTGRKLAAWLQARLLPLCLWTRLGTLDGGETATVLFSSGSTGEPKGIMLSHRNIQANIASLQMLIRTDSSDNVCAALPFFHSLGLTGTLWLPLISGFSASYHPNPLDGARIAELVRENRSTLLLATPTFLLAYLRRAKKEDFASLRLVIAGAEKLKPALADKFEEKFGIRPLEGYGATELAPVAAISVPDVEIDGVRQQGAQAGAVGKPLPGIAVRVIDPESGEQKPAGDEGLILIKGANVMQGYLNRPDKTAEAVRDGWYNTGDIGFLDKKGFLHITDRLARFSKIGGEMVPHIAIEEVLQQGRAGATQAIAVTAIPDERRGERLVVLYTGEAGELDELQERLADSDLPNLWRPGRDAWFRVTELPLLGTGKLDLGGIRRLALAAAAG